MAWRIDRQQPPLNRLRQRGRYLAFTTGRRNIARSAGVRRGGTCGGTTACRCPRTARLATKECRQVDIGRACDGDTRQADVARVCNVEARQADIGGALPPFLRDGCPRWAGLRIAHARLRAARVFRLKRGLPHLLSERGQRPRQMIPHGRPRVVFQPGGDCLHDAGMFVDYGMEIQCALIR